MNHNHDEVIQQRVAELEAENARLRETLAMVKAERRDLRERVYGPYPEAGTYADEQELTEFMKNRIPGDGMKFFAELGLLPDQAK
jgi:hypothetical protein